MASDATFVIELLAANERLKGQLDTAKRVSQLAAQERDEARAALKVAQTLRHKNLSEVAELEAAIKTSQETLQETQAERDYWLEQTNRKANLLNHTRDELDRCKQSLVDCYRGKGLPLEELHTAIDDIEAAHSNLLEVLAKYGYK